MGRRRPLRTLHAFVVAETSRLPQLASRAYDPSPRLRQSVDILLRANELDSGFRSTSKYWLTRVDVPPDPSAPCCSALVNLAVSVCDFSRRGLARQATMAR